MGEIHQSIKVNGNRVSSLLDSGATDNYISLNLANKLNLVKGEKYFFKGIDGKQRTGHISYVTTEIMKRTGSTMVVVTDLLPQDGYDIILGQRFLQDNEVKVNFKKDNFRFSEHQPKIKRMGRI